MVLGIVLTVKVSLSSGVKHHLLLERVVELVWSEVIVVIGSFPNHLVTIGGETAGLQQRISLPFDHFHTAPVSVNALLYHYSHQRSRVTVRE
jgi:hypothetical protein